MNQYAQNALEMHALVRAFAECAKHCDQGVNAGKPGPCPKNGGGESAKGGPSFGRRVKVALGKTARTARRVIGGTLGGIAGAGLGAVTGGVIGAGAGLVEGVQHAGKAIGHAAGAIASPVVSPIVGTLAGAGLGGLVGAVGGAYGAKGLRKEMKRDRFNKGNWKKAAISATINPSPKSPPPKPLPRWVNWPQ